MIRAAIVGMGWWGKTLVEATSGSSNVQFTVGASRHPTAEIIDFAKANGLKVVQGFEDAIADRDVDAVVLATPPTTHVTEVVAAAKAGKHVYCEKPFTLTKGDAERAVDAMRRAGK